MTPQRNYQALLAEGERIQQEREVFRQRAAAVIQGYRTRDAAFRIFRNEKLERYKTLFDLAAQYAVHGGASLTITKPACSTPTRARTSSTASSAPAPSA